MAHYQRFIKRDSRLTSAREGLIDLTTQFLVSFHEETNLSHLYGF